MYEHPYKLRYLLLWRNWSNRVDSERHGAECDPAGFTPALVVYKMNDSLKQDSSENQTNEASSELRHMLRDLFRSIRDPISSVREAVQVALTQLGLKRPLVVIPYCHSLLKEELKKGTVGSVCMVVLDVLSAILAEVTQIPDIVSSELIKTICRFIEKESASVGTHGNKVLVQLSGFQCTEVMENLLAIIARTDRPILNVIEVSGQLAAHHTNNIMQLLPVLLTQTMKYLSQTTEESIRVSLIITLGQYCDSVLEYLSVTHDTPDKWDTVIELLSPHTCTAVDLILNNWLSSSKDVSLLSAIYSNLGSIASLTESTYLTSHLSKVINCLTTQWRRANGPAVELALCQSLNTFVNTVARRSHVSSPVRPHVPSENATSRSSDSLQLLSRLSASPKFTYLAPTDLKSFFEAELDGLLSCLFQHLFQIAQRQTTTADNPSAFTTSTKVTNEIKRAFATLCASYPTRVWFAVQSHLNGGSELSRTVTLDLLRHLVSSGSAPDRSPFALETRQQIVAAALRLLFGSSPTGPPTSQQSTASTTSTPAVAGAGSGSGFTVTATTGPRRTSLKHSLMGDVVTGAPLGPNRDSRLLGEIASGDHLAPAIRFELIKLVLTLGSLTYLELDGGHVLVEFVIRQCAAMSALSDKASRAYPGPREIHNLCMHVMKLSSTTVAAMRPVLWPFLLEFLLPVDFTEAIGVVCDSIANLLTKPLQQQTDRTCPRSNSAVYRSADDCLNKDGTDSNGPQSASSPFADLDKYKNIPSPHKLFARFVVLLGCPIHSCNRGLPILRVMLAMANLFHPTLAVLWDLVLPRMMLYLNQDQLFHDTDEHDQKRATVNAPFNQKHWEELTLKMLLKSLEQIADQEWTVALVYELEQQIALYDKLPEERGFLYRCLAVALSKISRQQTIYEAAELIVQSTNHDSPVEQESCAECLGILSSSSSNTHFKLVLDLLARHFSQLDLYTNMTTACSPSAKTAPNRFQPGLTALGSTTTSSVAGRLTNLFRSGSSHTAAGKSGPPGTRPLPSYFRGSVEQARATILRGYTEALRSMPRTAALSRLDGLFKEVVGPVLLSTDQSTAVRLALIGLIDQVDHVIESDRDEVAADANCEFPVPTRHELIQCLLELLTQDAAMHSVSVPQSGPSVSTATTGATNTATTSMCSTVFPFPDPCITSHRPLNPNAGGLAPRHLVLETIRRLITSDESRSTSSGTLLASTAAVVLCLPSSSDSRESASSAEDHTSEQDSQPEPGPNELELDLERLWLRIIQLGCSDDLIFAMMKILIPYLHDCTVHVRARALHLLTAILKGIMEQLKTIQNEAMYGLFRSGTGLSVNGQLIGHLVTRLGDTTAIRKQAKLALNQLLRIQLRLSDLDLSELGSVSDGDPTGSVRGTNPMRSDRLLGELTRSMPQAQIPGLLELIWSGLVHPPSVAAAKTESAERFESSADEATNTKLSQPGSIGSFRLASDRPVTKMTGDEVSSQLANVLAIPRTEAGYLTRLLVALMRHRGVEFNETQVDSILRSVYKLYAHLSRPGLRAGVLQALAELGKHWPVICLQTIAANPLPLDLTWSVFLGAIAFIPVDISTTVSAAVPTTTSTVLFSSDASMSSGTTRAPSLPRLLTHVLHVLECCMPYERREIPMDHWQSGSGKRVPVSTNPDGPVSQEVHFATHAWLSFINCLQILSYPVDLDQLVHCHNTDQTSLRLSALHCIAEATKPVEPTKRRLFHRTHSISISNPNPTVQATLGSGGGGSSSSNNTTSALSQHSTPLSRGGLATYLTEVTVACRVLGNWLLAHATAAGCRTLAGKSYEVRSGAEANLKQGVRPITITADGLRGFLETCQLHSLVQSLTEDSVQPTLPDAVASRKASHPAKSDQQQQQMTTAFGKLLNPDALLDLVDSIARYVTECLPTTYLAGLIQFFTNHLNSVYEPHRVVATKWFAAVLCYGHQANLYAPASIFAASSIGSAGAINPDYLFDQLLGRLADTSSLVRRVAVTGLSMIANATQSASGAPDSSPTSGESDSFSGLPHPAAAVIQRHSAAVTRGLFLILNEKEEPDTSMLMGALHALSRTLPYASERQMGPLVGDLCQRLWPVYASGVDAVRAAAFELFGTLTRFAWDPRDATRPSATHSTLMAEAQSVFIPIVLHLADPSPAVVQVCKIALKRIAPLLFGSYNSEDTDEQVDGDDVASRSGIRSSPNTAEKANGDVEEKRVIEFLNNCLRPDLKLHQGEFFNELARLLVAFRPDQVTDYTLRCTVFYNSDWPEIQCSAVLFSGFLMGHFTDAIRDAFPRGQVCQQLLQLLRSSNPEVRATTAHAISRLYRF